MEVNIYDQLLGLLYSFLIGAVFALLYDSFRILRYGAKSRSGGVLIEDILYWIICALVGFVFILKINNGVIRFYLLVGMLAGALAYRFTLSKVVTRFFFRAADLIRNTADRLRRTAYRPIGTAKRVADPHVRLLQRKRSLKNLKKDFKSYEKSSKIKRKDEEVMSASNQKRSESRGRNEKKRRQKKKKRSSS